MRRHWQLVCCAFSFCWYHQAHSPAEPLTTPAQPAPVAKPEQEKPEDEPKAGEKKGARPLRTTSGELAQSSTCGQSLARTLGLAPAILAGVVSTAPTTPTPATP